jgi:hypothetical protein
MKDLYAKLGIEPAASPKQIAEALKQKPELAALGTILLNPQKRAVYDGTHFTLKTIGALRQRLGLDGDGSWFLQAHPDFAPSLTTVATTRQAATAADPGLLAERVTRVTPAPTEGSSIKGLVIAIFVVAALAALYLLVR